MKRFLCGVLAVLLPAAMCACGTQETATVRLSEVTHSVFYAPQYVALEQGFFADEGLNIELTNGGGADKVMTAVLTGQADIGLAGPEACIYVYNQGKDDYPVVFGQLTKRDGSFLVGRADVPFSWELLRGKTVIGGRAGGVPVLAHPMQYHYPEPELIELIETAKALGIRALEAYYSEFSAEQTAWLLRAAEKYGMGVSGGSDYHGTRKTHISMGTGCGNLAIPYSVLEELKKLR